MQLIPTCFLVCLALLAQSALGHTIRPAVATIVVDDSGEIDIRIRANAEAMLARIGAEHADTNDSPNAGRYNELRLMEPAIERRWQGASAQLCWDRGAISGRS